jgi:hypothetical protein
LVEALATTASSHQVILSSEARMIERQNSTVKRKKTGSVTMMRDLSTAANYLPFATTNQPIRNEFLWLDEPRSGCELPRFNYKRTSDNKHL